MALDVLATFPCQLIGAAFGISDLGYLLLGLPRMRSVVPDGDPRTTFLRVGDGWTSGFVVVNGFHLGRFDVRGPQRTLLVPRAVLRAGDNEVIAFDGDGGEEGSAQPLQLDSVAVPDLGKPIPL